MEKQISASIMCISNLLDIGGWIKTIENAGIDMLHLDAMDGHFVNNITFGPDIMNDIHENTKLPCDYHLMLEDPLSFIKRLELREGDMITIHAEIDKDNFNKAFDYLQTLRKRGIKTGIAINPETSIESLIVEPKLIHNIDMILVMMISPGFAGQPIIDGIMNKPPYIRQYLDSIGCQNIQLAVDGGITLERARTLSQNGVDIFVGGTSGLFIKNQIFEKSAEKLRNCLKSL